MKVLKVINAHPVTPPTHILMDNAKACATDAGKARTFRSYYAKVLHPRSAPPQTRVEKRLHRQQKISNRLYTRQPDADLSSDFTLAELQLALRRLHPRKACGPDGIYNEFLTHATPALHSILLRIANAVWKTGDFPRSFLTATIIPLLKPKKDPTSPKSFRPVALTSCLGKLVESMAAYRLTDFLERHHVLSPLHSGFRRNRSTTDVLARLVSDIHAGFQQPKPHHRTVATLLDLSSAFDRVAHPKLFEIFRELGIPPTLAKFYKGFLSGRTFRVRVGTTLSSSCTQTCGVPQGTCSGPVLFILYADSLLRRITPLLTTLRANAGMFADDLTVWKTGPDVATLASALTTLNNAIANWTTETNMVLAEDKCETILFSHYAKDPKLQVLVKGIATPVKDVVRLLGVYLDRGLTFHAHVDHLLSTTARRIHQLRTLANSSFGPSQSDLSTMYVSYIRSVVEYGALAWYPALSHTNANRLEVIQNKAARIALGVPCATELNSLQMEACLAPLHIRLQIQVATGAEKYRRFPLSDPLHRCANAAPSA